MNLGEMRSFTVDGGRATCDLLQDGSYVDYQFNGWRLSFNHGKGSSTGISFTDDLKAAEWHEYEEPVPQGWDFIPDPIVVAEAPKRRGRPRKVEALPINDIGDWQAKPEPVNPWAGIEAKQQGWGSYD